MAKKRHISQLDEPPIPASKDDHKPPQQEHITDDQEEEEGSTSSQAASSSEQVEEHEEEEDDDEEEDIQQTPSQPASKNHPPPSSNSHPKSSSSSEETDSESESDPEPNTKLKPLPSKPIKSKPQAQASPPPTKSGTKRPINNDAKQLNKKKKTTAADEDDKEPEDDVTKTGEDSKKYFQRLFSEDDELVILQALVDFTAKTGNDPCKHLTVFYEFVKKLIHVEVTIGQLRYKIRRLKQKFHNKVKSGKPPTSAKPIEIKAFELGLKIWGDKPNRKSLKKEPAAKKPTTTKKLVMEPDSPLVVLNESKKAEESSGKIDASDANLILNEMVRFDRSAGFTGLNLDAINKAVVLLDESQRDEFEGRWKKLHIAELELFTRRAELVEEQTCLILDALRSSLSH
ncbi:GLABROUS1 enhancer-binding protein-like [Cicer arietinum]|uniref:GLABROUS1 enhancer-binding protein-like n=1 Tax=Cicer arietinum TaxID=3827 RepID=A0A1S2YDH5_CICAR|nr:GLABROUS1 enhancer-binding protein-like [Cicer arietinum]